jgi:hypothetical protein
VTKASEIAKLKVRLEQQFELVETRDDGKIFRSTKSRGCLREVTLVSTERLPRPFAEMQDPLDSFEAHFDEARTVLRDAGYATDQDHLSYRCEWIETAISSTEALEPERIAAEFISESSDLLAECPDKDIQRRFLRVMRLHALFEIAKINRSALSGQKQTRSLAKGRVVRRDKSEQAKEIVERHALAFIREHALFKGSATVVADGIFSDVNAELESRGLEKRRRGTIEKDIRTFEIGDNS